MEQTEIKKRERLTLVGVIGGGTAGWSVNTGLNLFTETDMTNFYGISILLGVIIGLLWDIADKLNQDKS
ncbi:hypothetical protein ACFYKX_03760 [Cytobacillus sp. FJAT-54145]|uniref:Uncharacterized protein n=1 Tax=Cytobacillus spartinae TaxID=3299023 RepID=A0ABW6K6C6_9BACI